MILVCQWFDSTESVRVSSTAHSVQPSITSQYWPSAGTVNTQVLGLRKFVLGQHWADYKFLPGIKQNCRIWGSENPNIIIEKPMLPQRVTVWCEFWYGDIIEPFFFETEQGATVTVNGLNHD